MSIALKSTRGDESWLGLRLKPGPALYVDWELDEEEQGCRARELARGLADDEPPEQLYHLCAAGHTTGMVAVIPNALQVTDCIRRAPESRPRLMR